MGGAFSPIRTNRFFWTQNNQSNRGGRSPQSQGNNNRFAGQRRPTGFQRLTPRDENAMDIGKAVTEADKERHRKEGRCFFCSDQGHLARDCPKKKAQSQIRAATSETKEEAPKPREQGRLGAGQLAKLIRQLGEEDRDAFIKVMNEDGEELGFQDA